MKISRITWIYFKIHFGLSQILQHQSCFNSVDWKLEKVTRKKFVDAVLMDLSKAFESIPHDLLTAKINAYGFFINGVTFFTLT